MIHQREGNFTVSTVACSDSCLDKATKIIRDDVLFYFRSAVSIILTILIATVGFTANTFNIIVYYKQGFRDSVNITFMALSVWDLSLCFFCGVAAVCSLIDTYFPLRYFNTLPIKYVYVAYSRGFTYILATSVTVYLSVERCACVVFPLKVRGIFTTRRVILVNVSIVMFGLACATPAWATQGTQWVYSPADNITHLVLWISANRRQIDLFLDTFNGMALPILAQTVITIGTGLMIHGIKKSSRFRNKADNLRMSSSGYSSKNKSLPTPNGKNTNFPKRGNTMTNKDIKLTKVIALLTLIFFACNLPVVMNTFVRILFPEVDIGKQQQNLFELLIVIVYQCILVKSTVNIFVYYYASSRYKRYFFTLFGRTITNEIQS